ncbi:hypothetical protein ACCO45_009968 [Purpureocillium lilacinum]|uniref:Uncharacterized protein n=1 Tax=Purpureocillium lilacinum TaxID=33203 RepID=A0ACC4DDG8_PURLI
MSPQKAPNPIHLDALFVAIRANSVHLQTLELDFVNWEDTWDLLASDNAGDHEDAAAQNFLVQGLLGPDRRLTPLVLPDIRTLVLSQVPVTASMAKMISFESLVSLTLRNCPGWDTFLARAARLKCRIQLTTFELHSETVSPLWTQNTLVEFLGAFRGLEALFSPFAQLALEYVGIGYAPERLKYALLPFRYKNTLKVLHIRQSTSDLRSYPSWALIPSRSPSGCSGQKA